MKKNPYFFSFVLFALFFLSSFTATKYKPDFPLLKGKYLGQKPPAMTPEIFAPGIISTGGWDIYWIDAKIIDKLKEE